MDRYRVLTWHVHGSYLASLARTGHRFYVPVKPGRPTGYGGRPAGVDPEAVVEVPADEVRDLAFDAILFQSARNWQFDQHELLSPEQRRLPRVYVEHDPPRGHPTDTPHPVDDPDVLLVHVTAFNALMWDAGRTPTRVIDHAVTIPEGLAATYDLPRGIAVVNDLPRRGRRLGLDLFLAARSRVPLDLAGIDSESLGGIGELGRDALAREMARHRFYYHPVRYTSLGLAVIEAMLLGLPVVGLATTELPTVVRDGVDGFVATDPAALLEPMARLIADPGLAAELGANARRRAEERFSLERFARDWTDAFAQVAGRPGTAGVRRGVRRASRPALRAGAAR